MGGEHLPQFDKCFDYLDVDLDGSLAVQDTGQHGNPLFSKGH
jgi:hypothetical protein